ncbi:hypothetical protein KCP73_15270 [Salmonella enterica subsp. enterica]|nr:hypothetical protein KCP73_15270 [Salmonella enterica subsp. enterica]
MFAYYLKSNDGRFCRHHFAHFGDRTMRSRLTRDNIIFCKPACGRTAFSTLSTPTPFVRLSAGRRSTSRYRRGVISALAEVLESA